MAEKDPRDGRSRPWIMRAKTVGSIGLPFSREDVLPDLGQIGICRRRVRIILMTGEAGLAAYKIVLYAQEGGGWVAEIPAIGGCYALMDTRDEALQELEKIFRMIQEEYAESGKPLPVDRTELLVHAQRDGAPIPSRRSPPRIPQDPNHGKSRAVEPSRRSRCHDSNPWRT